MDGAFRPKRSGWRPGFPEQGRCIMPDLDHAKLVGEDDRMDPVRKAQLVQYVLHMGFDRALAQHELGRDLRLLCRRGFVVAVFGAGKDKRIAGFTLANAFAHPIVRS